MIAIHKQEGGFTARWISYCKENNIPFKEVNCYDFDIVQKLNGCETLFWHFHHTLPADIIMAKSLMNSLHQTGKDIFPDWNSFWHFDDKIAQKYLLEAAGLPIVDTFVFYDKNLALNWAMTTEYPKVFKLRGGAGSSNVALVKSKKEARNYINKAFSNGFSNYNAIRNIKERFYKWKSGKLGFISLLKGILRLVIKPKYNRIIGKEVGYVYFQTFIPNNDCDFRVIVVNEKAFAIKRIVRDDDFRASGSGKILYDRNLFNEELIKLSFFAAKKLNSKVVAFDFVYDQSNKPLIVEISYGFSPEGYDDCPGYWDSDLKWHEGKFNPYGWMIDLGRNAERKKY
jgi:glutathione synthase/RimK-type ligase-like ATP-grasp enzyme